MGSKLVEFSVGFPFIVSNLFFFALNGCSSTITDLFFRVDL